MYLNAGLLLSLMPATLQTRQRKVESFAQKFLPLLIENYPRLSLQNKSDDNPPIVKILYSDIMCYVMFDPDNKYSLNWYIKDERVMDEYKSVNMDEVGSQMMHDAETYFKKAAISTPQRAPSFHAHPERVQRAPSFCDPSGHPRMQRAPSYR